MVSTNRPNNNWPYYFSAIFFVLIGIFSLSIKGSYTIHSEIVRHPPIILGIGLLILGIVFLILLLVRDLK